MWTYYQKSGEMFHDSDLFAVGYAGRYMGKNNPLMQAVKLTGPLPVGIYRIGDACQHPHKGPLTMRLIPDAANEMYGRYGFMIHGERIEGAPGFASEGCIILNHGYRQGIAAAVHSGDRMLEVRAERET